MTGTFATALSAFFRPSPPRGMIRSTTPSWVASSASCSRPPVSSATAPSGSGATIEASTALECAAAAEPRSTTALPDFSASAAASTVTFGRDS